MLDQHLLYFNTSVIRFYRCWIQKLATERIKAGIFQSIVTIIRSSAFYSVYCLGCYNLQVLTRDYGKKFSRKTTKASLPGGQSLPLLQDLCYGLQYTLTAALNHSRQESPMAKACDQQAKHTCATQHQLPCIHTGQNTKAYICKWPLAFLEQNASQLLIFTSQEFCEILNMVFETFI